MTPQHPAAPERETDASGWGMSGEADMAARIIEGRIRHGVGSSEDFPGNVCHLVSPIVGYLRLRQRDGEAPTDLDHIIDRLSLVLDMARQEATPEPSEVAETTAGEREWVRRVLVDPRFRVGPDVRREELVDVIAAHVSAAETKARAEGYLLAVNDFHEAHGDHCGGECFRTRVIAARVARGDAR